MSVLLFYSHCLIEGESRAAGVVDLLYYPLLAMVLVVESECVVPARQLTEWVFLPAAIADGAVQPECLIDAEVLVCGPSVVTFLALLDLGILLPRLLKYPHWEAEEFLPRRAQSTLSCHLLSNSLRLTLMPFLFSTKIIRVILLTWFVCFTLGLREVYFTLTIRLLALGGILKFRNEVSVLKGLFTSTVFANDAQVFLYNQKPRLLGHSLRFLVYCLMRSILFDLL